MKNHNNKGDFMKKIASVLAVAIVCTIMIGCAHTGVGHGLSMKNMGKEKVVEKNGSRPDWAIDKPMYTKDGILYAGGMFTDAPNLSKGLMVANKQAQAKIVESIRTKLRNDFTYASEGLDIDQTMLEQILNTTTNEMIVSGFFQNKQYYEKKEVQGLSGFSYKYDCYALAEITKENYMKALDDAFNKNKNDVSEAFRQKVEKRQEEFFNKEALSQETNSN